MLKHRWWDVSDTVRTVPDAMAERLARRVAASEARHTGEVRLCVEAALPMSYVWRLSASVPIRLLAHERARSWFGRLGVWDTEHNNGVLIYLLLSERLIELVADRALAQRVEQAHWQAMVDRLSAHLHDGRVEDGLTQALEQVSALLVTHFPLPRDTVRADEVSNAVVRA